MVDHDQSMLGAPHHLAGKSYAFVFFGMLALMSVSIALATTRIVGSPLYDPAMDVKTLIAALAGLAAANGMLLLMFFMNLRFETKTLKMMVLVTFSLPLLYGVVLLAESIWRHL